MGTSNCGLPYSLNQDVFDDYASFHHEVDLFKYSDITKRVTFHSDNISKPTGCN